MTRTSRLLGRPQDVRHYAHAPHEAACGAASKTTQPHLWFSRSLDGVTCRRCKSTRVFSDATAALRKATSFTAADTETWSHA